MAPSHIRTLLRWATAADEHIFLGCQRSQSLKGLPVFPMPIPKYSTVAAAKLLPCLVGRILQKRFDDFLGRPEDVPRSPACVLADAFWKWGGTF